MTIHPQSGSFETTTVDAAPGESASPEVVPDESVEGTHTGPQGSEPTYVRPGAAYLLGLLTGYVQVMTDEEAEEFIPDCLRNVLIAVEPDHG